MSDIQQKALEYCKMYSNTDSVTVQYTIRTFHELSDKEADKVWEKYIEWLKA